jgi:hypothetical protein
MKRLAAILLMVLAFPVLVMAGEIKATVVKLDKAKNQAVVRTDKGDEMLDLKGVKGGEHVKEGARVLILVSDNDGKVTEVTPSEG